MAVGPHLHLWLLLLNAGLFPVVGAHQLQQAADQGILQDNTDTTCVSHNK